MKESEVVPQHPSQYVKPKIILATVTAARNVGLGNLLCFYSPFFFFLIAVDIIVKRPIGGIH